MKFEHFAFNVEEPTKMAAWYVKYVGLTIVSQVKTEPFTTFLSDESGRVMIEVYKNPPDEVPDYENMDPLIIHLAFISKQPDKDKKRLIDAGASVVSDEILADGSHLVMLRDPWGFSIQFCKRANPMLTDVEKS